ncbi:indole-3-glycerol phosphate synthase TrpC [Campylobacter troglodytis]|uniref:indole-3-glycerol phosphate synthase TrpC n=1 Tax=Campylobacter troglodytis TaxID=654363 RepID=UPI00115C1675|nr:indole-3-glycerol phosphate synthase TrpC [Campylobacter troglodytis]TQR59065.1 indole-3-glycerol phosphate synthase TrpC [Campylobacter troglodytis]
MILDEIFAKSKKDLLVKKEKTPLKELEKLCFDKKPKDLVSILKKNKDKFNIIAEIKKASPSKGLIRQDFKPLEIAKNYAQNKACVLSVLTERNYFQGELEFLELISKELSLPLLRKDFIFDPYQILESLVFKADLILLIARFFEEKELKNLADLARSLKLEVLFEIHSTKDLQKALYANAKFIGINHRDLNDFSMNMRLCYELVPQIPKESIIIAESGLDTKKLLLDLDELGIDAFLIGEHFMRQKDEGKALKAFVERI